MNGDEINNKTDNFWTDECFEAVISNLLRVGLIIASVIVVAGGIYYLFKYGLTQPEYDVFRGEPQDLKSIRGIIGMAFQPSARAIIEIGLLLLIATPIARVVISIYAFARKKEITYVYVTAIVLLMLLFNLFVRY
jgi:uncharacterized membrane protein